MSEGPEASQRAAPGTSSNQRPPDPRLPHPIARRRRVGRAVPTVEGLTLTAFTLFLALASGLATVWFLVPFLLLTVTGRSYRRYGLTRGRPQGFAFHSLVTTLVFGGYAAVHVTFVAVAFDRGFSPAFAPDWPRLLFDQVVIIGLSEEFFFRGYLQTQLDRSFGRPCRFLGARWGWGLILASLVFGACHIVHGDLAQMRVAGFGLFAGWLRERTGSVLVPAVYHGLANVLYDFLQRSTV